MTLEAIDRYDPDRVAAVGDRAVVLGGSVAGLCAARVLADAFEEVVVLERDSFPNEPVARDGAPQSSQPHVMLEGGRATLEDLFPGFSEDVMAEGGLRIDASTDLQEYNGGGYLSDPPSRLPTYCASRPLFEQVARRHIQAVEGVDLQGGQQFLDYVTDDSASAVTGVHYRDDSNEGRTLSADLVVDATGRTSKTPTWLSDHGYDSPRVDEVTIDMTYSTVRVRRPPTDRGMVLVAPDPPRTRGGAMIPVEGDRWEVILQGVHGDTPPTERTKLVEFAESLPVSDVAECLRSQAWLCEQAQQYPYPASRRYRYESVQTFPDGLVITGDALASFNPIYGQGMSVAALDAVLLHHALATEGLDGLAARFFDRATTLLDGVWRTVVGGDFAFAETTGPKPRGTDLANWYMKQLIERAQTDPLVSETFARMTRLEKPPSALLRPRIAWRVLRPTTERADAWSLLNNTSAGTPE